MGLGLIGGSIALEIKKHKLAQTVMGVSRSRKNQSEALRQAAVDEVYPAIGDFLKTVDLIILATPPRTILKLIDQIQPYLAEQTLVTDVGSTKATLVAHARRYPKMNFIGGHPIAGTEQSGMQAAQLELFSGKHWILTPDEKTSRGSLLGLKRFLAPLGCRLSVMSPEAHDKTFALLSHLPNLISFALSRTVHLQKNEVDLKLAGSGFKGMTRLAMSPPEMWRDIWIENRAELLKAVRLFEAELAGFKKLIRSQNEEALLEFAKLAGV